MTRVLLILSTVAFGAGAAEEAVTIRVAASRGRVIPQSKGGGGFERKFYFTAARGKPGMWIRQELAVRGTVFDKEGRTRKVHLDVVEYYRVYTKGKAKADTHYSQYWSARGGDLTISSTLAYGKMEAHKRNDPITSKSFVLRGAKNGAGDWVTMKTRDLPRRVIPAERGERVSFAPVAGVPRTNYRYRVQWDSRKSRTRAVGSIETGTWRVEVPEGSGRTKESARSRPISRP